MKKKRNFYLLNNKDIFEVQLKECVDFSHEALYSTYKILLGKYPYLFMVRKAGYELWNALESTLAS